MKSFPAFPSARRQKEGFALVLTLLILSLLVIVAVSYLSSAAAERQTAEAYSARTSAEQAAQTGVDNATAMLAQCFRDFPDSVTAWDTKQTANSGSPNNGIVVTPNGYNEGTDLYLRAVPTAVGGATVANPLPTGPAYTNGTSYPANDASGNDPNNPACETFVLPLISGVLNGRARLVGDKETNLNSLYQAQKAMDLSETDPVKQTWTDVNIRRVNGDIEGIIGSDPDWINSLPSPKGPKPARAYWVNLTGSDGRLTGRYAFWIDDESFRANVNYVGDALNRADNADLATTNGASLRDSAGLLRGVLPSDMILAGLLFNLSGSETSAHSDGDVVINTRAKYPGSFMADRLAFLHNDPATGAMNASGFSKSIVPEYLRYLTTTQSGSLNLTRHGTQRLNLNSSTTMNPNVPVTFAEIQRLVETIRFHLPNFGQHFYRTANPDTAAASTKSALLNNSTQVTATNAEMYLYKTAANLRDYIDVDDQPTMIVKPLPGNTVPRLYDPSNTDFAKPLHPFGSDGSGGNGNNYMWAQGKDGAPFIQETMVRYRPAVQNSGDTYSLTVDYYVELWNMSDHDISASSLSANGNPPYLRISSQQPWVATYIQAYYTGSPSTLMPVRTAKPGPAPGFPSAYLLVDDNGNPTAGQTGLVRDFNLDLVNNVYNGDPTGTAPVQGGVIFKAGTATVITTDPDAFTTAGNSKYIYGEQPLVPPSPGLSGLYKPNVYYCAKTIPAADPAARRTFSGPTGIPKFSGTPPAGVQGYLRGIMPDFSRDPSSGTGTLLDYEVEVSLANDFGWIDCASGAFSISAGSVTTSMTATNGYDFTWRSGVAGDPLNDYLHGGSLPGNSTTPSELGDPRTNNEQLYIQVFNGSSFTQEPDQNRYAAPAKTDKPPFTLGTPNAEYVKPAMGTNPWPDYYDWPTSGYPIASLTAATAPSVIANSTLTSIGQLGDIFDPLRVIGTIGTASINNTRGGGRTLRIGQHDDRFTYDTVGNPTPYNDSNHVPASNGWASWRLTDIFSVNDPIELPARININGVTRDKGAALRAMLHDFTFQPATTVDPLIHGASASATNTSALAGVKLSDTATTDTSAGVGTLINQITNRLNQTSTTGSNAASGYSTPWGPFFERGEFGELDNANANSIASVSTTAMFGKNTTSASVKSTDLTGVDLNRTFDRGREELFRRIAELICTRGDTFTVYAVGQSLTQATTTSPAKVTGTHRMRVTFRLVPKQLNGTTREDFHPGYDINTTTGVITQKTFSAVNGLGLPDIAGLNKRFAKPDSYEVQILEASSY